MPIANCIVTSGCKDGPSDLIELWSKEAGISRQHMTINIMASRAQFGNRYDVMATLLLPSMWSGEDISALQTGLARALSQHFALPPEQVHVVTNIVDSGFVVEAGEELSWR